MEHLDQLPSPRHERRHGLLFCLGQRAHLRTDSLSKERQDLGIDGISFGQLTRRPCEVAHLAGVDHRYRQSVGGQRSGEDSFIAAGGFNDDQLGLERAQTLAELGNALCIIGGMPGLGMRQGIEIESIFGHIDPDKGLVSSHSVAGLVIDRDPTLQHTGSGPYQLSGFIGRVGRGAPAPPRSRRSRGLRATMPKSKLIPRYKRVAKKEMARWTGLSVPTVRKYLGYCEDP